MKFLIIFLCLVSIGIIALVIYKLIKDKHTAFLTEHSISLRNLSDINKRYVFLKINTYDESHTYDNSNFYNNISCQDYLIYILQFKNYSSIKNEINNANDNNQKYKLYCEEVDNTKKLGNYDIPIGKLNSNFLLKLEDKMFKTLLLKPITKFTIKVTLYCAKINGNVYDSKYETFNSEQIMNLIKRIHNKNGSFFLDKGIWDAICRVERGKVSNKMRFSIYNRDGYRCRICGRSGVFEDLEIDHIKPIAKGGKSEYNNLQTLCKRCNYEKGDRW